MCGGEEGKGGVTWRTVIDKGAVSSSSKAVVKQ